MNSNKNEIFVLFVFIGVFVFSFLLLVYAIDKEFHIFDNNSLKVDKKNIELFKKEKNKIRIEKKLSNNFTDEVFEKRQRNSNSKKSIKSRKTDKYSEQKRYAQPTVTFPRQPKKKKIIREKLIVTDLSMKPLNSDIYDSVEQLSPNVFKVQINHNYGLIDNLGRYILPVEYFKIRYFEDGLYIVSQLKDGFVELLLDEKFNPQIVSREINVEGSYIFAKSVGKDNSYDLYDKSIRKIATIKSSITPRVFHDEFFVVRDKNFHTPRLVNKNNQYVISPIFDFFYPQKDEKGKKLIYVHLNSKIGVLTLDNQVLVPAVFNSVVQQTYNGSTIYEACIKNKCAYFDENGEMLQNQENMPYVRKTNVEFLTSEELSLFIKENK